MTNYEKYMELTQRIACGLRCDAADCVYECGSNRCLVEYVDDISSLITLLIKTRESASVVSYGSEEYTDD